MQNHTHKPNQNRLLIIAVSSAVLLVCFFIILPNIFTWITRYASSLPTKSSTPEIETTFTATTNPVLTSTITQTHLPESKITATVSPRIVSTTTPFLLTFPPPVTGEVGVNLPINFEVGPWYDNHIECDQNRKHNIVKIHGVTIYGGTPPFHFRFWQSNQEIPTGRTLFQANYFIFLDPIEIKKGAYVHVVIKFHSPNGDSEWIDDLYYHYLNDPNCKQH